MGCLESGTSGLGAGRLWNKPKPLLAWVSWELVTGNQDVTRIPLGTGNGCNQDSLERELLLASNRMLRLFQIIPSGCLAPGLWESCLQGPTSLPSPFLPQALFFEAGCHCPA